MLKISATLHSLIQKCLILECIEKILEKTSKMKDHNSPTKLLQTSINFRLKLFNFPTIKFLGKATNQIAIV